MQPGPREERVHRAHAPVVPAVLEILGQDLAEAVDALTDVNKLLADFQADTARWNRENGSS